MTNMHLTFTSIRMDQDLTIARAGDVLILNDDVLDLTALPDGATLPDEAIDCPWINGPVHRIAGELHIRLLLPHGGYAPDERKYMPPLTLTGDGAVPLPPYDGPDPDDVEDPVDYVTPRGRETDA